MKAKKLLTFNSKLLTSLLFLTATATPAFAGDIYVSTKGNDANNGSEALPVKSIDRAFHIAREWRRTGSAKTDGGIYIHVEKGTYFQNEPLYIRPEDSGTQSSKTIVTTDGMEATITSGVRIDEWRQADNWLIVADAPKIGGRPLLTRNLWTSKTKLLRSSHLSSGKMERLLDFNAEAQTITIPASSLLNYGISSIADAPQLEMVVHQRWAIAILRVKDIRIIGDRAVLTFLDPESKKEFSHPWPQPIINGERGSSSFFLTNARQFLDEPGEWWQDYSNGKIYMVPSTRIDINDITMPTSNRLLTIEGDATLPVHDIAFVGMTFRNASWESPMKEGLVTLQGGFSFIDGYKLLEKEGLPWDRGLENQAWVKRPEAAISISYGDRIDFVCCNFRQLAATGLDYVNGCHDARIEDCNFTDIGGTAILAGSFGEGALEAHRPYKGTMTSGFTIKSNIISDVTNEDWGTVGIGCGYVKNFTIEENEVSHVNYSGIAVGWGWTSENTGMSNNSIRYNKVHDFCRQLYDGGGIYTLSNQPRSVIEKNKIWDLHNAPYATNERGFYIYLDAKTDGYNVNHNDMPEVKIGYNNPGPSLKVRDNGKEL